MAYILIHNIAQSAGSGKPYCCVRGARVIDGQWLKDVLNSGAQFAILRNGRHRSKQEHDAKIRVRGDDLASRTDGLQDSLTNRLTLSFVKNGCDGGRAQNEVFVAQIGEVAARMDVARFARRR